MTRRTQSSPASAGQRRQPPDDRGNDLPILTLAVTSTLAVTAAIVLIALVRTGWVAGLAVVMLLAVTGAIVAAVLRAVRTGPEPPDAGPE